MEDATLVPGWERIGRAAANAALSPGTWIPAAGALVLVPGDYDEKLSRWLVDHTPIFGSEHRADQMSSDLKSALRMLTVASVLATSSGDDVADWTLAKAKGGLLEWSTWEVVLQATNELKPVFNRERPNKSDNGSFFSANASQSFAFATLISRNAESIAVPEPVQLGVGIGSYTLAGLAGLGRVESNEHYATDVLVGAAFGHFVAAFLHDAFGGLPPPWVPRVEILPGHHTAIGLELRF